jgi:two-component system, NarL family, nitrate/nitrite response regulator NarL
MKNPVNVILIEDNPEYRYAIELSLKNDPTITLSKQFGTAELALRELEPSGSNHQAPDLILLDLNLPGMSGHETIPWLKKYTPQAKIIILTQSENDADVIKALKLGASGYLLKSALIEKIQTAILNVMQGGGALDPQVIPTVLRNMSNAALAGTPDILLTPREHEILSLLAEGLQKKEIANNLQIGLETVSTHIKHTYQKLEVANAPAAISKAYQIGILKAK